MQLGLPGGDGEYDVQEGFGWTNGVLLHFFDKYGQDVSSNDEVNSAQNLSLNLMLFSMILFLWKLN